MKQRPSESFKDNLVSPFRASKNNPEDVGLARAAAQQINAHAEWVFKYHDAMGERHRLLGAETPAQFRSRVIEKCPELKVIWHAADGAKHRDLSRRDHELYAASTAQFVAGEGPVKWIDGRPFISILEVGMNYWREWPD